MSHADRFAARHIGPRPSDIAAMVAALGYGSLDEIVNAAVPENIRLRRPLNVPEARDEQSVLASLAAFAGQNRIFRSYLGSGYADCITPPIILRNVLENPGWYTAYTPYQAEIAQGRLEALLNFQTVVADLTGLEIANASLLDEATAVAEAMAMTMAVTKSGGSPIYLVDEACHPQTIAVLTTRAEARGIRVAKMPADAFDFGGGAVGGAVQYPGTEGNITDFQSVCDRAHAAGALVTAATDLLSLTLLAPPGEWGADIAVGNSQRFGVPLGYGGPHAAFFATRGEYKRHIPGRIIGVSRDRGRRRALRMALQTREQHIRREKATSNICTAQVLLAVVAALYAVYHGPEGLRTIAERVHRLTTQLAAAVVRLGYRLVHDAYFDTIAVEHEAARIARVHEAARAREINLRPLTPARVGISLDETTTTDDVADLIEIFGLGEAPRPSPDQLAAPAARAIPGALARTTPYLTHSVFHRYRSETEMLRYLKQLENRDLSLTSAMIPLGSCTLKLNATTEMMPVTWPAFARQHPFAPVDQNDGYRAIFGELERYLAEITGLPAVSLQPNAGSQGEFAGLLVIGAYHRSRGHERRNVCLIPQSAHGTNPASAVMAGLTVVPIRTDAAGNVDVSDLREKVAGNRDSLAALMITYPSTHGVFEASIKEMCGIVHQAGGQIYMDGANLNAQVGLCRPGDIGADVCHLNLHKTFCIPHGGGGPGMGPIAVGAHLEPFLPNHPAVDLGHKQSCGTISAAPWGSPSVLPISWAYIALMGPDGLTEATKAAILNANYVAHRLIDHYRLLYAGDNGLIAHECIIDPRQFKSSAGIDVEDIAKRLIDYGFHPPTVSFPVPGTLMIEPTESESKEELDRFCEAMIAIREEIREIEEGKAERGNNLLSNAPHTLADVATEEWDRSYSRERAIFPSEATRQHKVWPFVSRVDGAYGDRNLECTLPSLEALAGTPAD